MKINEFAFTHLQGATIFEEALEVVDLEEGSQNESAAFDQRPHDDTSGGGFVG